MSAPLNITPCFTEVELGRAMPMFYVVGKNKLIIMTLLTLGCYSIYWEYKNWRIYRTATGERIWPLARAIFSLFFIYSLFMKIDRQLRAANRHYNWRPYALMLCAVLRVGVNCYVVLVMTELKAFFPIGLALLMFDMYCKLRVQAAINHLERDPEGLRNAKITLANFIWIALGGVIWFFFISGALLIIEAGKF